MFNRLSRRTFAHRLVPMLTLMLATTLSPVAHADLAELFLPPFPEVARAAPRTLSATPSPLGRWVTASGNLEVEIGPCGTALCGTVTRVMGQRSMRHEGDMHAVDTRPALGLQILQGLAPAEDDDPRAADARWFGDLYDRETDQTYRCRVQLAADGSLAVRPFVLATPFGQTQHWLRVPQVSEPTARTP